MATLVFKLTHRVREVTLEFEACTVSEALALLEWDARRVTIQGWTCHHCIDGDVWYHDDTYTLRHKPCDCPQGQLVAARQEEICMK